MFSCSDWSSVCPTVSRCILACAPWKIKNKLRDQSLIQLLRFLSGSEFSPFSNHFESIISYMLHTLYSDCCDHLSCKPEHTLTNTNVVIPLLKGAKYIHAIGLQVFNNKKNPPYKSICTWSLTELYSILWK